MKVIFFCAILAMLVGLAQFLTMRWRHRQLMRRIRRAKRSSPKPRLIVCLSSLPERIKNIKPTLDCLLNQTSPPEEIVLYLPQFSVRQQSAYEIPDFLSSVPRLRIVRTETDWGPATKYIPAIQEELAAGRGRTLIITVDDDRTYPLDALETYLHYHDQFPDAALCFRGGAMPRSLNWRFSRMILGTRLLKPKRVAVMTGCGSYAVQPRFFDKALWDYSNAPRALFYMDDMWMSGWLDRRGVQKFVVPTSQMMRAVPEQEGTMTLQDVPNGRRQNNNEAIAFFRDSWNVFRWG
jgi:hypothetical protein